VLLLVGLLYGSVLLDLAHQWWRDPSVSYGILIPPLAILIAWLRRGHTFTHPVKPNFRGLSLIALACLVYLTGKLGAEFFLPRISFVILLAGFVWTFWGTSRLRSLAFPLVLLATMVPLPVLVYSALSAPLQLFASNLATSIAQAVGVSVYREGNIINLANISLGVEEACSGLNSLSSMVVASLLLGFLQCGRTWTRALLFLLSIPLSIGMNVLRIAGTAVMADYHEQFALGFYHSFSGWLIFVCGFALLYGFSVVCHRCLEQ
jgi:exosortase